MSGVNSASNFLQANNVTPGEAVIFIAAALAFISFLLPWTEAMVPMMGKVTSNGFSIYAFLLGIIFIPSVWLALAKHRYIYGQSIGYVCAVTGFIEGILYPRMVIEVAIDAMSAELGGGAQEAARGLISVGAGS